MVRVSVDFYIGLSSDGLASGSSFLAADSSRDMTASPFAAMGNAQPGQPQDFNKLFKAERDNLEFAEGLHSWVGENMDTKILRKYGKLAAL
jgi:hypothetical protein